MKKRSIKFKCRVFVKSVTTEDQGKWRRVLVIFGNKLRQQFSSSWQLLNICHLQQTEIPQDYIKIILTQRTYTYEVVIWRTYTE